MKLEDYSNKELKLIIKKYNLHTHIKGYSKMKKNELISNINKHLNQKQYAFSDIFYIKEKKKHVYGKNVNNKQRK